MRSLYQDRRLAQRAATDADQAEFAAITRKSAVVDAGIFDDRIAGSLDDFDPGGVAPEGSWHQVDLEMDSAVGGIREEIERRLKILGSAYPFQLKANELVYTPSDNQVYEFCLAISCAPTITKGKFVDLPRVFERASALFIQRYLGKHTQSLHTGFPRDESAGKTFRQVMKKLNEASDEWIWSTHPDLPPVPPDNKDEGLDFVVWKESLDKRVGKIFIVGQCACGDDWDQKLNDLSLPRLDKWFHPLTYVPPVRAFTTPHFLSDGNIIDAQREAGVIFDRARITLIADRFLDLPEDAWITPRLQELAKLVLKPLTS
jgi:hypothetical protein